MTTPYMSLAWPTPGVTAGPDYAAAQVTAIALIDAHDHSAGKGALVPSSGLNINSDLDFGSNDAAALRMARFDNQSGTLAASNLRGIYVVGGELYFNDGSGTAVQITSAGSVAGAAGNISGLASPAAVTWDSVNKIFAFTQTASFPAKIQCGDLIIYETAASPSNAVTIKSPASLASAYAITLPAAVPATSALLYGTTGVTLTFLAAPAATSLLQQTAAGALSWATKGVTALADAAAALDVWMKYVITPSVVRILTLPSAGVAAGDQVEIVNLAAAVKVTINASAGATKAAFQNGAMKLYALQATPTTPAHWGILEGSGGARPSFRAYRDTSNQTIASTSATVVEFNGESDNNNGDYDSTINFRFTPKVPGEYAFFSKQFVGNLTATDNTVLAIRKNGTPVSQAALSALLDASGLAKDGRIFDKQYANGTTDYFDITLDSVTDASYIVVFGATESYFTGVLVGY